MILSFYIMGLLEKLNNKSTELINIFMDSLYIYMLIFFIILLKKPSESMK